MFIIKSIKSRIIYNSHAKHTNEFVITLDDGSVGIGASPQGETISIYEDRNVSVLPAAIIEKIISDGYLDKPLTQETFDAYLEQNFSLFGRNNAYGLSEAFFNARAKTQSLFALFNKTPAKLTPPALCCNILNGGWHAYTNPVLSDFSEFILVSKSNNIAEVMSDHATIQRVVYERLSSQEKTIVAGNPVNRFAAADNRAVIEFLLEVVQSLNFEDKFDLMIDASAGDLRTENGYCLAITDNQVRSCDRFFDYWLDLIRQYKLGLLEDPFCEQDSEAWHKITTTEHSCQIIGDNFYSSCAARVADGAAGKFAHGVIVKPNQSGTVTAVCRAIEAAQCAGQIPITSHRSISTESVFLSLLTCVYGVPYIKIGPLLTDYSAVVRLNEIIRLTESI